MNRRLLLFASAVLAAAFPPGGEAAGEASATAVLHVSSEPADAQVHVNHQLRGTTPLTIEGLAADTCLVTIRKPGFEDVHRTVSLLAGVRHPVQVELEPLRGLLLVTSAPAGAEVSIDGADYGTTPLLVPSLRLGTYRVRLSAPGFQAKEAEVELTDRTPRQVSLDLASDSGTLHVSSEPGGARVMLDGIPRGTAPCAIDRIPGGDHELEVGLDGYVAQRQTIRLAAGETQSMRISLAPQPAALQIVSIPDGARVYVDNQFQGETPHSLLDLKPGEYRVRVEMAGHDPQARNIALSRGERRVEEFRLSANTGRLEITTEPADVTVLVDGRKAGVTSAKPDETTSVSSPFPVEAVPAGEHELRFVRKGYFEKTEKAVLQRGVTTTLHVTLQRRFIPDYEVTTANGVYRGVLVAEGVDGLRLETRPGVEHSFAYKDIVSRKVLREEEE
ncbi:MAG: PEGA domain-containing protein [Kiritimatiellia bacterium]|jgi:hypothetical protein